VVEGVKEAGVVCAVVEVSQEVSRVIGVGVGCVAGEELVAEVAFGAHRHRLVNGTLLHSL